jgi:hypothetical protein
MQQFLLQPMGQMKSQGVVQKTVYHKSTGTLGQPMKTPYPNGDKIKLHAIDLTFEVSGFVSNTTVNFLVVQEKKGAAPFDPWQAKTSFASQKARHMPYLLPAFNSVDDRMSPIQIDWTSPSMSCSARLSISTIKTPLLGLLTQPNQPLRMAYSSKRSVANATLELVLAARQLKACPTSCPPPRTSNTLK